MVVKPLAVITVEHVHVYAAESCAIVVLVTRLVGGISYSWTEPGVSHSSKSV